MFFMYYAVSEKRKENLVALSEGKSEEEAIMFASAASSTAVTVREIMKYHSEHPDSWEDCLQYIRGRRFVAAFWCRPAGKRYRVEPLMRWFFALQSGAKENGKKQSVC